MAFDKVIDSTQLDAAMTYTANRIRNKTGDTNQIAWDSAKGFGDAVDAITGGGSEFERKVSSFIYYSGAPDEEFVANLPNVTSLQNTFTVGKESALKSIDITVTNKLKNMYRFALNASSINTIILRGDLSGVTTYAQAFSVGTSHQTLTTVKGLDFTSATNVGGIFGNQSKLTTLEIKADTINIPFSIAFSGMLSVESCINILNALKDRAGQDALTLTCHNNLKTADTGRLYVNYVKFDADTGLYVSCEQTDEGAMTIAAAITAKNWTIA